jgi:ribosomal protection tetracycline resistance protein
VLGRLRAVPRTTTITGPTAVVEGMVPAARVHDLEQQLPALTRGEGVVESAFDHHQPVRGTPPTRPRTDHNPRNRKEYLLKVTRRVPTGGHAG